MIGGGDSSGTHSLHDHLAIGLVMAADVALAVENGLNGEIISNHG